MSAKEIAQEIRKQLKEKGYNSRQVSVSAKAVMYDDSITVTIKDLTIPFKIVNDIAEKYESIRYDEYCGEILNGCNIYVHVQFDYDTVHQEREKYMQFAKDVMEKYKDTPIGQLETIARYNDLEILYAPKRNNGNCEVIEVCQMVTQKYIDNDEEYRSINTLKRRDAHNEYAIAEALVYFVNQYSFKIAV